MKSLKDYILEAHDMLGHEIKVGDWIQFQSGGYSCGVKLQKSLTTKKKNILLKL